MKKMNEREMNVIVGGDYTWQEAGCAFAGGLSLALTGGLALAMGALIVGVCSWALSD